jgi:hypothetical protein
MTKDEALKLALEALDIAQGLLADARSYHQPKMLTAYTAVKQALAAPVQPVANIPGLADDPSAFIRWALKNNYDTSNHPMFFVMLHPKTNAAREGWKAAVEHYQFTATTAQAEAKKGQP